MSSLVAATRPMRRDMFKAPLRLLAAVLLVALPVGFVTALAVESYSSTEAAPSQHFPESVEYHGGTCTQSVDGYLSECSGDGGSAPADMQKHLNDALPDGFSAHRADSASVPLSAGSRSLNVDIEQYEPELFMPQAPAVPGPGEIYLSSHTASTLNVDKGDKVTAKFPSGDVELTVLGIAPGSASTVTAPTMNSLSAPASADPFPTRWRLSSDRPVTWEDVLALNKAGFTVKSESVMDNLPDAAAQYAEFRDTESQGFEGRSPWDEFWESITWLAIYAIALILVLLFIAPVFTLALNRHTRMFALMSSQGASPGQITAAVLSYALFAGVIGATLGLVFGAAAGWGAVATSFPGWAVSIPWGVLATTWLVAVVGSVIVAFIPARMTARNALAAALGGAEPDRIIRWRAWMGIGPAVLAVLTFICLIVSFFNGGAWLTTLLIGPVPMLIAVVAMAASAPALMFGAAKLATRMGLTGRLAGRGLMRASLRSVPTVAALLALTFTVTVFTHAIPMENRKQDALNALYHPGEIALITSSSKDTEREDNQRALDVLSDETRVLDSWELEGVDTGLYGRLEPTISMLARYPGGPEDEQCTWDESSAGGHYTGSNGQDARTDPQAARDCYWAMKRQYASGPLETSGIAAFIADASNIDLWSFETPADREAALATLGRGGIVGAKDDALPAQPGQAAIGTAKHMGEEEEDWTRHEVLGVAALPPGNSVYLVSRAAAEKLDLPVSYIGTAALLADNPGRGTDSIAKRLHADAPNTTIRYTTYGNGEGWIAALMLGGASLVALILIIALGAQGIRRENSVLHAIGSHPALTAKVAAMQTWLVGTAAMGLGVIAGHLAILLTATRDEYNVNGDLLAIGELAYFTIDWWLVGTAVVVPLIGAAVAWFVHRPRATDAAQLARDHGTDRSLT